jgi:regulator of PEP synthase PpsR (kinase-PPPase family)
MSKTGGTVFVVSDGTGETASTIVKAALVQYPDRDISLVRCKNIRSEEQIETILEEVKARQGTVVFTVVSSKLREKIEDLCHTNQVPYTDLFGPLLSMFSGYFVKEGTFTAGLLRQTDEVHR